MKIKIEDHYHFIVYVLGGNVTEGWAEKLKQRILFELEEKSRGRKKQFNVIMDLADVESVSPAVVETLGKIAGDLRKKGSGLAVCKLEPEVRRQFEREKAFLPGSIFPSVFAAKLDLSRLANE